MVIRKYAQGPWKTFLTEDYFHANSRRMDVIQSCSAQIFLPMLKFALTGEIETVWMILTDFDKIEKIIFWCQSLIYLVLISFHCAK